MHELNFVDKNFDLKLATEYHISIQVSLDGFSFCILDTRRSQYLYFKHIPLIVGKPQFLPQKIESVFAEEEVLGSFFKSVSITYSTNKATLIPKGYAEPQYLSGFAEFTNEINRGEEISVCNITGFPYQLVYSYPRELMSVLTRKFTDFRISHKAVPVILTGAQQRNTRKSTIVVNFEKKYIRMVVLKGNDISLFNSFYYKNEADFLYYTLNVCNNLQIDPDQDEILIGGFVADESGFVRILKKYISNVNFLRPMPEFGYGGIFERTQKHQFVSLFNTYSCV